MISRSGLKLGHLGSKSRSPDQIESFFTPRGHSFEVIIINRAKIFVLMISRSNSKLGYLIGVKKWSPGQSNGKPC